VQLALIVAVTEYVPGARFVKFVAVDPLDHKTGVPAGVTVIEIEPFPAAVQSVLGVTVPVIVIGVLLLLTVAFAKTVQPFAPVTVTGYVPAVKPVIVAVVCPPPHKKVKGATPPAPETVAVPAEFPQVVGVVDVVAVGLFGVFSIVKAAVCVQVVPIVAVTE
jgi:hypothetical protein